MQILRGILTDFIHFFNPKTRGGFVRLVVVILACGAGIFYVLQDTTPEIVQEQQLRGVTVSSVETLHSGDTLSLVGTVKAIDQATIQSEVGGQVTAVRVALSDRISRGQVIATLENQSQAAAVLQAEGAYEAALAASAQSTVGVNEAQNALNQARSNAVTTYVNAYTIANNVVLNNIDTFFTNPQSLSTPGLRLEGKGHTQYLNDERVAFQSMLTDWRTEANTLDTSDDVATALSEARSRLVQVLEMVDVFITILNDQSTTDGAFSNTELVTYSTTFNTLRANINGELSAIANAQTALANAAEAVTRAEIGGSGGSVSAADASVKQALGALEAARANYNKTILRSPIAGEVHSLSVSTGDYISPNTVVATVANKAALEITTFVNPSERNRLTVGDTVAVDGSSEGTITAIAPAVDPSTGKIEVRIQSAHSSLQNGDTVRVVLQADRERDIDGPIVVPIAALKVETDRIVIFTVSDEQTLVAHEIVEGPLLGGTIVIESGITKDMSIVLDARGLNEGDEVVVLGN